MASTYKTLYGWDWPMEMSDELIGLVVGKKWREYKSEFGFEFKDPWEPMLRSMVALYGKDNFKVSEWTEQHVHDWVVEDMPVTIGCAASGKMLLLDEPLMFPEGPRTMRDVRVGDRVLASTGHPVRVTGVYDHVDKPPQNVTLYPYTFTATPAQGWSFVRFNITSIEGIIDNTSGVETDYQGTSWRTTNPFVLRDDFATSEVVNWDYFSWLGAFGYDKATGYAYFHKTWHIEAVFERVPTDLLVNSSTIENPAKLVYDPTTNRLVADF